MISIKEYLLSKNKKLNIINATNDTIKKIVKDELDRLGHDADLNHIDVSEVTDMDSLFSCSIEDLGTSYRDLNPDISQWYVGNVTNMDYMFYECENFNKDLSKWNVSKVEHMARMFSECRNFNQDLSKWDVSKVTNIRGMFAGCKKFNQDLSKLNISKTTDMEFMFDNCSIKEEWKPKFKD